MFLFLAIQAGKMCFAILLNAKTPFQAIKTRSSKSRKIDIFPKGLTHGFGPKMTLFPIFFLANIVQENVFYDILKRKKPFQAIKKGSLKRRKIGFFPKELTHGFASKIAIFPTFFQAILAKKTSFTKFQNNKTPFLAIK